MVVIRCCFQYNANEFALQLLILEIYIANSVIMCYGLGKTGRTLIFVLRQAAANVKATEFRNREAWGGNEL